MIGPPTIALMMLSGKMTRVRSRSVKTGYRLLQSPDLCRWRLLRFTCLAVVKSRFAEAALVGGLVACLQRMHCGLR